MIQIVAKAEDIQSIITGLDKIGIHGMTRMKIAEWNEFIRSQEQDPIYPDSSLEIVMTVIPEEFVNYAISSIETGLYEHSKKNSKGLLKDIHISICEVEKEFDIT